MEYFVDDGIAALGKLDEAKHHLLAFTRFVRTIFCIE